MTGPRPAGPTPGGRLPGGFVLNLPKVTSAAQVEAMARLCGRLEEAHGLPPGRLAFEVQVETPQRRSPSARTAPR